MFGHYVRALNWLSSCFRRFFMSLSWFQKHKKVKRYDKSKLCIPVKDFFFEKTQKRPRIVFVFLSGEMMQLSLLSNYWALLSIYGNLIYTTKAQCCGTKMAPYFNDLKDEESFERRTGKLSTRFLFFWPLLTTTRRKSIVQKQTMTAYLWTQLSTINNKIFFLVEYYGCYILRKIHIVRHVQHFCCFWEYFQLNKYHCFCSISFILNWIATVKTTNVLGTFPPEKSVVNLFMCIYNIM